MNASNRDVLSAVVARRRGLARLRSATVALGAASLKSRPGPPSSAGTGAAAPSAHVKIAVRGPKDAAPQIRTPPLASRVATKVVRRAPRSAKKGSR